MKLFSFVTFGSIITPNRFSFISPYICGLVNKQAVCAAKRQNVSMMTIRTGDEDNSAAVFQPCTGDIEAQTLEWVQNFVIKLNLCPFAQQILRDGTQRIIVSPISTSTMLWECVKTEISHLLSVSPKSVSTALLVFPRFAEDDFLTFHEVCMEMEGQIEDDENLVDEVMLAYFHPFYTWADANSVDDAINFDKRAPFPIVNLLRAPQVDKYIEEGRTQGIVDRNRDMLQKLGDVSVKRLFLSLSKFRSQATSNIT